MCDGGGDGGAASGASASDIGVTGRGQEVGIEVGRGTETAGFGLDVGVERGERNLELASTSDLFSGRTGKDTATAKGEIAADIAELMAGLRNGTSIEARGSRTGKNLGELSNAAERSGVTGKDIENAEINRSMGELLGRGIRGLFGEAGKEAPEGSRGSDILGADIGAGPGGPGGGNAAELSFVLQQAVRGGFEEGDIPTTLAGVPRARPAARQAPRRTIPINTTPITRAQTTAPKLFRGEVLGHGGPQIFSDFARI